MDAITQSIVSRYEGEYAPEAANRTIPPGTTLTIGVNARDPWVPYLYKIGGWCNGQNLAAYFLDGRGVTRYSWTAWPDVRADFSMVPLIPTYQLKEQGTYNSTVGNFFLVFVNDSEDNVDIGISMEMFLIDEAMTDSFEAEFKELYKGRITPTLEKEVYGGGPPADELDWKKRIASI